jgi:antitoxin component of MazEF toxin-antitoxin module
MTKEYLRKIVKNGRANYVNIPKAIAEELKWKDNQRLRVRRSGDKIVVEDWPAQRKLF